MDIHEHISPTQFEFEGYENKENSTCLVMSRQIPGFILVGNDWDEIEKKLVEAATDFLRFDGYEVESFELVKSETVAMPNFRPTGFKASFSGKKAA